jgi:hypothetical protein
MDEGLRLRGPGSDAIFDDVHGFVTQVFRRRRSGTWLGDRADLDNLVSRGRGLGIRQASDVVQGLLDSDAVERVDGGFRLLVEKQLSPEISAHPGAAGREGGSLVAQRLDAEDANSPVFGEASAASRMIASYEALGGMEGSAQNAVQPAFRPSGPRVKLCRDFFPSLVENHDLETIPRNMYWQALCSQVKKLEWDYQIDTPFIRLMMLEFVKHPLWCRRSRRPAWQVFISRREELIKLVHAQRKKNPDNRRRGRDYWISQPPTRDRHMGDAEYWLGRRP